MRDISRMSSFTVTLTSGLAGNDRFVYNNPGKMKKQGSYFKLDKKQIECPDDAMVEIYRKKTPMERIKIASDMWDSAWQQLNAVLRSLHPDWNNETINKEIIKRLSHHESL